MTADDERNLLLEREVDHARQLIASVLQDNAQLDGQLRELAEQVRELQAAHDAELLVEQARGVLMARLDLEADAALEILRQAAEDDRDKIAAAAAAVVAARRAPSEIAIALGTA